MSATSDVGVLTPENEGSPQSRVPRMPLGHYLQLIHYKVLTELRAEVERTYLGVAWWIIDPIISMAVYYLVFALLFHRGGPDFVPFLFVGLLTFRWLNTCVCHGAVSIRQETGLMQQVYLPKIIFPIVTVLVDSVKFCFAFLLLLSFLTLTGHPLGLAWVALPFVLFVEFVLILGTACTMAAIVPFVPDLEVILGHLFRMLFFVSGVFYAIESIPEQYRFYLRLNPIASLIEIYRMILLEDRLPAWQPLVMIAGGASIALVVGFAIIRRFDRQYPKLT